MVVQEPQMGQPHDGLLTATPTTPGPSWKGPTGATAPSRSWSPPGGGGPGLSAPGASGEPGTVTPGAI